MPWSIGDRIAQKPWKARLSSAKAVNEFNKTDFLCSWKSVVFIAAAFVAFMVFLYLLG
jgi:hypothetical protein